MAKGKTKEKPKSALEIDQEYELVDISGDTDTIKEHPRNPNQSDDALIGESIDESGWYGALICQKSTGYILAGHGRLRAARERGADKIPVIWRDVDDETALKILVGDNEIPRHAQMDEELLGQILDGLETLRGTGFGLDTAEARLEADETPDAAPRGTPTNESPPAAEPDADGVPDDKYTPQFGVMIVCADEQQQEEVYEIMTKFVDEDEEDSIPTMHGAKLRVVAV